MDALSGGWLFEPHVNTHFPAMNEEQHTLFTRAFKGIVGASYVPVIHAGQQVVSGVNYYYIALQKLVVPGSPSHIVKVIIHKPLSGDPVIISIENI